MNRNASAGIVSPQKLAMLAVSGAIALFVSLQLVSLLSAQSVFPATPFDPDRGILLRGTVVTMNEQRSVITHGNVLVRNGRILAIWQGPLAPNGTPLDDAIEIDLGPDTVIFPGLINLHNHPTFSMLHVWPPPSSHVQASLGRPMGTEPYANRYQWSQALGQPAPEFLRLVVNPEALLSTTLGLGLYAEVEKYSEIRAVLGGETATQGAGPDPAIDNILIRNLDNLNFGRDRIESRVRAIGNLTATEFDSLLFGMRAGNIDAWLVHLAEGVRDSDRRSGDPISSRAEFATLQSLGLLTDMTVIVHGVGLQPEDFVAMRAAPTIRLDGSGDRLGAKLVWSPLSNLLLYGKTALVYQALKAGVLVSLGTDWGPSGSRNLLDELKIADIALRDPRLLGPDRELLSDLSLTGKSEDQRRAAEAALDRLLVEMVTINPAKALRWTDEVGSIEPGKVADLIVISKPHHPSSIGLPDSPYRNLIDATEEDIRLVLVNGEPLSGDVEVMATLKPDDYEVLSSTAGCFQKAIDVTNPAAPKGLQTLAYIQRTLRDALAAMGGDNPPAGGGPADNSNTYSDLKSHIPGAAALTDAQFRQILTFYFGLTPSGRLNIEGLQLSPLLIEDDDFYFHVLESDVFGNGLIADTTPPFALYRANFNHVTSSVNPFASMGYRERFFSSPRHCALQ